MFGILGLFSLVLVAGALLTYYGQINQTVDVDQAVTLTGTGCTNNVCDETLGTVYSPDTRFSGLYVLTNHDSENSRDVELVTSSSPWTAPGEIVTSYWTTGEYDEEIIISGYSIPAVVTVKDLGDSVEWTIDMDETVPAFTNGHAQYGLIISTDKVHPAFQVHSNDGTCLVDKGGWVAGTHLYSAWDDTIPGNYNGWNTGGEDCEFTNTLAINEGIVAIGEYSTSVNTDAIFTITIPKIHLGYEEFYWAMQLMGNTVDTQYPSTWVKWSGDASTFADVELMASLTSPFTMVSSSDISFVVKNEFMSTNFDGTITTEVIPN